MKIFLSYPSAHKEAVLSVCYDLRAEGHEVFFDKEDLPPAQSFNERIRGAIEECDLFVFMITPEAVKAGKYTLTELKLAKAKWQDPRGRVLPVMLKPTPFEDIPAYLKSVTALMPEGNLSAEVVLEVAKNASREPPGRLQAKTDQPPLSPQGTSNRRTVTIVAGVGIVAVVAVGLWIIREPAGPIAPSQGPETPAVGGEVRPKDETIVLEGDVTVRPLRAGNYRELHQNFIIEARELVKGEILARAQPGAGGDFSFEVPAVADGKAPSVEYIWRFQAELKWDATNGFVLWPVSVRQRPKYAFERLEDVYISEKLAILADVKAGHFKQADELLHRLEQLLGRFDYSEQKVIPGYSRGDLEFKLLQEICTEAHDYRGPIGRSKVTVEAIGVEREWRKKQFVAAWKSSAPERALVRSLNAWADFSRESYSRGQRQWPERQAASIITALADPYGDWLLEDLVNVADQLGQFQMPNGMPESEREVYNRVVSDDADKIVMSRLVDLLSNLAALHPPPRPAEGQQQAAEHVRHERAFRASKEESVRISKTSTQPGARRRSANKARQLLSWQLAVGE